MKGVRQLLLGAAVLGFSVSAQAAPRADSVLITQVSETDLRDLVLAAGDTVDELHPFDEPSVRGKTGENLKYLLIGSDCPADTLTGCKSIMMQVRYNADQDFKPESLNEANYGEAAVATWFDKETNTVGFTRFVNIEGGVTWGNLKANLKLAISAHWSAFDFVWPPEK